MTTDKITAGLTPRGAENLKEVMDSGWFEEEMDAYRVAIGTAIAHGLCSSESEMAGVKTKWNVGSLDRDGSLRPLVIALVGACGDRPYEYAERLADAGLAFLVQKLVRENGLLFEVLVGPAGERVPTVPIS